RPKGPPGGRIVAHGGHFHLVLCAAQSCRGAPARSPRARTPGVAGGPNAPGADLQGRGGDGDPAVVRRPPAAQDTRQARVDPVRPRYTAAAVPDSPLARRGRRLPASAAWRRARRVQSRRRSTTG